MEQRASAEELVRRRGRGSTFQAEGAAQKQAGPESACHAAVMSGPELLEQKGAHKLETN